MLDWAKSKGIGFSHFISLGDSADVDFGDVLDYLGSDPTTRSILLYIESIKAARKFMSAARAAARNKPVILVKAGRGAEGAAAALSHTGALAGSDSVFEAAIRRAGMLRVETTLDLFGAVETLARAKPLHGDRLVILTTETGRASWPPMPLRRAEPGWPRCPMKPAAARSLPAAYLVARQPGGHHRRRAGGTLREIPAGLA